jgi:hypothetical protein
LLEEEEKDCNNKAFLNSGRVSVILGTFSLKALMLQGEVPSMNIKYQMLN